jgi:hypothetical protein
MFVEAPLPEAPPSATMDVGAADLDGDGDLDLVLPQEWRANRVLLNQGRGRFVVAAGALPAAPSEELAQPPGMQNPLSGKDSEDVSITDFDGDGVLDLILAVEDDIKLGRANVHQYYRGLGGARYERINGQLPDTVANAVAHADVNRDGAVDVLIAGDAQDRLLINDGAGGFRDETEARLPREAELAQDAEFFDADNDGDADLVFGLEGGHALWINDGSGVFRNESRERLPSPGNVEARKVTPADIDGDGDLDLYFAHASWQGRDGQDRLFINDGTGRFTDETAARLPHENGLTLDAKVADLDGDGDLEIVLGEGGGVRVLVNEAGRFRDVTAAALPSELAGVNIAIELADLNQDGQIDLYVGQLSQPNAPGQDRLFFGVGPGRRR